MKKLLNIIIILLSLFLMQPTFAMLPVVDFGAIANLIKEFEQLKAQYDLLRQTYENAKAQLNSAKELVRDAEGHSGYGDILNSEQALQNRAWSPDDWDSALKGLAGGNAERYHDLVKEYEDNHPSLTQDQYEKGTNAADAAIYENQIQNNKAATVTATYAFNDIKTQLNNIHELSQNIEKAGNEKAAIDLNTRMQTEIAYTQVQILKQMALMNEQMASTRAHRIQYESEEAKFNQLPK